MEWITPLATEQTQRSFSNDDIDIIVQTIYKEAHKQENTLFTPYVLVELEKFLDAHQTDLTSNQRRFIISRIRDRLETLWWEYRGYTINLSGEPAHQKADRDFNKGVRGILNNSDTTIVKLYKLVLLDTDERGLRQKSYLYNTIRKQAKWAYDDASLGCMFWSMLDYNVDK